SASVRLAPWRSALLRSVSLRSGCIVCCDLHAFQIEFPCSSSSRCFRIAIVFLLSWDGCIIGVSKIPDKRYRLLVEGVSLMLEVKVVGRGVDTLVLNVCYADERLQPVKR